MRANFHQLPSEARASLITHFDRISLYMNEQEVCSTLHGLAKMDGKWAELPEALKKAIINCTLSRMDIGKIIDYIMFGWVKNCPGGL